MPFPDLFTKLRRGKTAREAASALQDVVNAVRETGKQGTVTIKLKVSKGRSSGVIEIDDLITTVLPKPQRDASIFFPDADGNLHRDNPDQDELPGVRAVPSAEPERTAL